MIEWFWIRDKVTFNHMKNTLSLAHKLVFIVIAFSRTNFIIVGSTKVSSPLHGV